MGKLVSGRNRNRFFQSQLSGFEPAGAKVNDAKIGKRIEVVRALSEDFLVLLFGGAKFAVLEILFGVSGYGLQIGGHVRLEAALCSRTAGILRRGILFIGGVLVLIMTADLH